MPDSPAETDSTPVADDSGYEHPLVRATRSDLESAGQVGTVQSELALVMAKRLTDPDETGFSSLAKEFRVVLAEALGVELGQPESDPAESDEVAKARQAREQARQAAGL